MSVNGVYVCVGFGGGGVQIDTELLKINFKLSGLFIDRVTPVQSL